MGYLENGERHGKTSLNYMLWIIFTSKKAIKNQED